MAGGRVGGVRSLSPLTSATEAADSTSYRLSVNRLSVNFPRFDVNPTTGEPLNDNRRWNVADNAVFHDRAHPSHILLPVVPAAVGTTPAGTR